MDFHPPAIPLDINRPGVPGRREAIDTLLANNLVVGRLIKGMTQHELAAAAGISRATIAQLETGYSDPRLSTVVDLAMALGIPPILLLFGLEEVRALNALRNGTAHLASGSLQIPKVELSKMLDFLETGMLKDRLRAAQIGAAVARGVSHPSPAIPVAAGILSAILPGTGTTLGAALGELMTAVNSLP